MFVIKIILNEFTNIVSNRWPDPVLFITPKNDENKANPLMSLIYLSAIHLSWSQDMRPGTLSEQSFVIPEGGEYYLEFSPARPNKIKKTRSCQNQKTT